MSSATDEAELRRSLSEIYASRATARSDAKRVDAALDRAERLGGDHPHWRLRLLVERAHHRSRRHGLSDPEAVAAASEAFAGVDDGVDPVLAALVMWEASRFALLSEDATRDVSRLIDLMKERLPVADRWGIPPGDVLGYLSLALADMYEKLGQPADRLQCLRAVIDSPHCDHREIGKAYRFSYVTLRQHLDLDAAERLADEFGARQAGLNADGQAHYARLMGYRAAEVQNLYRRSIGFRVTAWELATSPIARGNIASAIAYSYCRLREPEGIEQWAARADEAWDALGAALVGRAMAMRYRAVAASIRGDWHVALERCADALALTRTEAQETWANVCEVLAGLAEADADRALLEGIFLQTYRGPIAAAELDQVAAHALGIDQPGVTNTSAARIAIALAALAAKGWVLPSPALRDQLIAARNWLDARASWWRAGRCCMALADLARLEGELQAAAVHVAEGLEHWRQHQERAIGEDHPWLVAAERDRFLAAWAIAAESGDHELAARLAEAGRGTALAALLSDPSLAGTSIATAFDRRAGADRILHSADEADEAWGLDDEGGSQTQRSRAALVASAVATKASLDDTVARIWRMLGSVENGRSLRPTHGWTVWLDIHRDQLFLAAVGPDGKGTTLTRRLPEVVARHVRGFSDPAAVQAKVIDRRHRPGLVTALSELGSVFETGPLGTALASAAVDSPVELRVSPGGLGWAVPWSAVRVLGEPLLRRAVVTLVPSDAVATELDRMPPPVITQPVVVFDPTLSGTKIEHDTLKVCWPTVQVLRRAPSGELREGGLFVASVHGEYGAGGLRQCLVFPDRRVDGADLFAWDFPALTVFGACWVGRVDAASSGDALGLVFPVLARGARTFLGGMFGIHDDETGRILADVYSAVATGTGAAAALRAAQLSALDRLGEDAPLAHWAGLCALGAH